MTEKNQRDYIEVNIFKNAPEIGFTFQIRWSAQKPVIERLMTSDSDEEGINEARAMIDHSIRIKAQSQVKTLVAKILGVKTEDFKGGNYSEALRELTDEQKREIQSKMIDWQYSSTVYMTDEEKAANALKSTLKKTGMTKSELLAMLADMPD